MYALLLILLRILFPLDPVAQLREATRYFISGVLTHLNDWREELEASVQDRAIFEGMVASAEEGIKLLIHERTTQILSHPYVYTRRPLEYPPRRPRDLALIIARLNRVLALQDRVEELAQRRAARMRREAEQNPLRLAPSAQSTSPACAVEAKQQLAFNVQIASLSATHWGRWIARACAQDGGGPANARGPPLQPNSEKPKPPALHSPARSHPHACAAKASRSSAHGQINPACESKPATAQEPRPKVESAPPQAAQTRPRRRDSLSLCTTPIY